MAHLSGWNKQVGILSVFCAHLLEVRSAPENGCSLSFGMAQDRTNPSKVSGHAFSTALVSEIGSSLLTGSFGCDLRSGSFLPAEFFGFKDSIQFSAY